MMFILYIDMFWFDVLWLSYGHALKYEYCQKNNGNMNMIALHEKIMMIPLAPWLFVMIPLIEVWGNPSFDMQWSCPQTSCRALQRMLKLPPGTTLYEAQLNDIDSWVMPTDSKNVHILMRIWAAACLSWAQEW